MLETMCCLLHARREYRRLSICGCRLSQHCKTFPHDQSQQRRMPRLCSVKALESHIIKAKDISHPTEGGRHERSAPAARRRPRRPRRRRPRAACARPAAPGGPPATPAAAAGPRAPRSPAAQFRVRVALERQPRAGLAGSRMGAALDRRRSGMQGCRAAPPFRCARGGQPGSACAALQ